VDPELPSNGPRALVLGLHAAKGSLARSLALVGVRADCELDLARAGEALLAAHEAAVVFLGEDPREGVKALEALRAKRALPLLAVSEASDEAGRVLALEKGADGAISWPLSPRELAAQLRALARRARGAGPEAPVRVGDLEISSRDHLARLGGRSLGLTTAEFEILRVLAEHAGGVLTRERILELTRGNAEDAFDRSVDVHISRLRHKLGDDPRDPRFVRTVRGVGYLLAKGPEAAGDPARAAARPSTPG